MKTGWLLECVFFYLLLTGCSVSWEEVDVVQSSLKCGQSISEIRKIAETNNGSFEMTQKNMAQITKQPDEFVVFFDQQGLLSHADRAKVNFMLFGLIVENEGYYEVLDCNKRSEINRVRLD